MRLQDVILRGLAAARPLATAVAAGTLFYSTDIKKTEQSDGTTWLSYDDGTSGSSGAKTFTSALASPPATPTAGDLWFPTNSFYVFRYSGRLWIPWGPIFPFTDPSLKTWTVFGSASVSVTNGSRILTGAAVSGPILRGETFAVPTPPYTVTFAFIPTLSGGNYGAVGICLTDGTKYYSYDILNKFIVI